MSRDAEVQQGKPVLPLDTIGRNPQVVQGLSSDQATRHEIWPETSFLRCLGDLDEVVAAVVVGVT